MLLAFYTFVALEASASALAFVRAGVHVCVHACMRARVRVCVRLCFIFVSLSIFRAKYHICISYQ